MNIYKLEFFKKGDSLCGDDFENQCQIENINLDQISSFSVIEKFHLPFSGDFVGDYSTVRMNNGDTFFISESSYNKLYEIIYHG